MIALPWRHFRVLVDGLRRLLGDRHLPWLLLLFAVEAAVFYRSVVVYFAPYFPMNFDQVSYYLETYGLIDLVHQIGWRRLADEYVNSNEATGVGFTVQGAVLGLLAGPSRAPILSLNLAYFALLQFVLFQVVRERAGTALLAWIAVALLLSCNTAFVKAGGIFDYRIDFSAMCLYGIWICTIIWSRQFRSTKRAIVVGIVGVLLVTMRFLTVVYLGAVLAGAFIALLVAQRVRSTRFGRALATLGARNAFISGALTAAICGPMLFAARQAIYNYYVVGHIISDEKNIRARENGVVTLLDDLWFYPHSILREHLGYLAREGMLAMIAVTIVSWGLTKAASLRDIHERLKRYSIDFVVLTLAILVPVSALTADLAKSPVVGDIVVVPVVLFTVLLCLALWPGESTAHSNGLARKPVLLGLATGTPWRGTAVGVLVLVALAVFAVRGSADPWKPGGFNISLADRRRIADLNDRIARFVIDNSPADPSISIDQVTSYLNLGTLGMSAFERYGRFISLEPRFGYGEHGIFATPRDVALQLIRDSDIIVLSDPVRGREAPYPMNTKIREYWDEMWSWTTQHRAPLASTEILGVPYHVFVPPTTKIEGTSGDWITSGGITLSADAGQLRRWPFIILDGKAFYNALGGVPRPQASLINSDVSSRDLPATLQRTGDDTYEIVIDARGVQSSAGEINIKLTFDRYFVPNQIGAGPDARELVIFAPNKRDLKETAP